MESTVAKVFEPVVGVAEFAQMIREAGKPICNKTLLAMARAGAFVGYDIYIYRMGHNNIEGFIPRAAAERWISDHSVEVEINPEYLAYARMREETTS